MGLQIQ